MFLVSLNNCFLKLSFINKSILNLKFGVFNKAGRSKEGFITSFKKGSVYYHKMLYFIDFWRRIEDYGYVLNIKKLNDRTSFVALICYLNGIVTYILSTDNLLIGSKIYSGNSNFIYNYKWNNGDSTKLSNLFIGCPVSAIEIKINKGAQICRAAGTYGVITHKVKNYIVVKLKSGLIINILNNCFATVGIISNGNYKYKNFLKAGAYKNIGRKQTVRGVAMNAVDHPHGGGRGKSAVRVAARSPWGKLTKFCSTRNKLNSWRAMKQKSK